MSFGLSQSGANHELSTRLADIRQRIPPSVRLIGVTKTFSSDIVQQAYDAGLREFAENKVQEALPKQAELGSLTDVIWHFIGHIQSNKALKVVENFDWIHSVDSLKLAARLDRQAKILGKRPSCCLQVKLVPDPAKTGFEVDTLMSALADLDRLSAIDIRGLMVIPPYGLKASEVREIFERGTTLAQEIARRSPVNMTMDQLSMGMSGDFEQAIAAGATMVRIGSGLFGPR
ncbi:YggS family pyridoxal phosphate-dependent enzyme [cf. Phormidesmis sp. LEGE 11477]|uniref:YggS family pyridoxal phosphate-dependent enzyme n=1 Tax=cf. Phormidesmis sp. LEGE 11477 TaxID=1828680 RepID=UPI0018819969|nr:YggS family pyridoxal phosphate-dependent enzyme [cf. Phormidesmis sp. LEGE 11477]MBE9060141.1 YggS family pyridoxal phosphate-dependent enzyme [cf. Phormidesmis sp. LEGE 11477]